MWPVEKKRRVVVFLFALPVVGLSFLFIYQTIYVTGESSVGGVPYTHGWVAHNLVGPVLALTVFLTAIRRPFAAIGGNLGCSLGVLIGDTFGEYLYELDVLRHEVMAAQPDYVQQSDPQHPGWLICIITIGITAAIGSILDKRFVRKPKEDD